MVTGKRRLSPSKAIWCVGDKVDSNYESSCARYVTWERRFEKDANVHDMYKSIGDIDEARYAAKLVQDGVQFVREQEFTYPIGNTSITIEGRYDFKITDSFGDLLVEKKSITSANRAREIITKGNIDQKHLAQLVSYMAIHKILRGRLAYSFWKWAEDLDGFVVDADRSYEVEISPAGAISIDGQAFPRHVRDVQKWYRMVADALEQAEAKLPDRPLTKAGWQNPCKNCPLAVSCDKYDIDKNITDFWHDTKNLEARPGKPAEIIAPKIKKGRKNEQVSNEVDPNNDTGRIQDKTGKHKWEVD